MDQCRFAGFQRAMTEAFGECKKEERLILLSARKEVRRLQYDELLPRFREAGSLAFISDYLAIDAVDYFIDKGVRVPEDISITGFDDTFYAELIRPRLTTVHQNIGLKASTAMQLLLRLINREKLPEEERNIKIAVQLVVREVSKKKRIEITKGIRSGEIWFLFSYVSQKQLQCIVYCCSFAENLLNYCEKVFIIQITLKV